MDARAEISTRLADLGWSISRLAREAQVDRADLTKWLNGTKENITTATLDALRLELGYKRTIWSRVPR